MIEYSIISDSVKIDTESIDSRLYSFRASLEDLVAKEYTGTAGCYAGRDGSKNSSRIKDSVTVSSHRTISKSF